MLLRFIYFGFFVVLIGYFIIIFVLIAVFYLELLIQVLIQMLTQWKLHPFFINKISKFFK